MVAVPLLTIRPAQMHVFEQSAREQFVVALAEHLSQDRTIVAATVERAVAYGFRDRGHIAQWAGLEARYGVGFEDRPECKAVRQILDLELDPATKLYKIDRRLHPSEES